ncbi:UbiA prenyltransferase family protein [Patescibacteria group bacterium]
MAKLLYDILKTARPRQWVKNVALFAPLIFSGFLFFPGYFTRVFQAFLLFSTLASALYFFNDISDVRNDRHHPFKKKRPIAAGSLPIHTGAFVGMLLLVLSLIGSRMLSFFFFLTLLSYALLQFSYTLLLKKIPIFDVISIAASFVLRVYAGAFVVNLHMNVWFLLAVLSASLFLAVGKRQSERTLLKGVGISVSKHRVAQGHYTQRLLDIYTGMFANTTWLTYALFTFQFQFQKTSGPLPTLFSILPQALVAQKWLMITIPIVIYGVMRYLQLVYEQNKGESPERVLLSDKPILTTAIIWVLMVIGIIYGV